MTTASACRHDTSSQSTLTLTLLKKWDGHGPLVATCSECNFQYAHELGPRESPSRSFAVHRLASALYGSKVERSNFSAQGNSSSLPVSTQTDRATSGREDYPGTSPKSASNNSTDSGRPSSESSAVLDWLKDLDKRLYRVEQEARIAGHHLPPMSEGAEAWQKFLQRDEEKSLARQEIQSLTGSSNADGREQDGKP